MKLFTGWAVSAGLVLAASAANAQMLAPNDVGKARYQAASDVAGPYTTMPPPPPYAGMAPEAPATRYGPALLPPLEVYTIVRENGFSPLGIPHQRGYVYMIAVLDRAGEDGRLIIDARNGQIIRFMPAFRTGGHDDEDYPPRYGTPGRGPYGPSGYAPSGPAPYGAAGSGPYDAVGPGALPPTTNVRGVPRPPASIPRVASRAVPVPAAKPAELAIKPAPQPMQQSAAVQPKPADAPAPPPPAAAPTVSQAKPAPSIQPTQEMPKVQGLE